MNSINLNQDCQKQTLNVWVLLMVGVLMAQVILMGIMALGVNGGSPIKLDGGFRYAASIVLPEQAWASPRTSGGAGSVEVRMDSDGNIILEGGGVNFNDSSSNSWNQIFSRYRNIIVGLSGFATLTMLGAFIFLFTKLGATSGNDQARRQTITGIMFTGIATALLGSVTIIMGFFYNAFSGIGN